LLNQAKTVLEKDADIGVGVAEKPTRSIPVNDEEGPRISSKFVDDEASEDEGESDGEQGDGDTTSAKKKEKRTQQSSYDEEDADVEKSDDEEEEFTDVYVEARDERGKTREDRITDDAKYVCGYQFDKKEGKWCDITLQVYL
jgi:hypothetical protein